VAFTAEIKKENLVFHLILNAYWEALDFELPPVGNGRGNQWRRWIDTALDSPNDIVEWQSSASITGSVYRAEPRSVVVLFAGME
jgi:glycogen operon protein